LENILDPNKKIGEMPKNLSRYYQNRFGFSFYGYNFFTTVKEEEVKRRLELSANVAQYFCIHHPQYQQIEVALYVTPISTIEKKHKLDGIIQHESFVRLNCKTLETYPTSMLPEK
jgi:hypothetical protein